MRTLQPRHSLSEQVATSIREAILEGSLRPGERLIELNLAETLGVSRGPIREAIRLLVAQGLLCHESHRGVVVPELTERRVRDVYGLRAAIETRAIHLIGLSPSETAVGELTLVQQKLERAVSDGDRAGVANADLEFHETICQLSGNPRLHNLFQHYSVTIRMLFEFDERVYSSLQEIVTEHYPVLNAVEAGQYENAARLLRSHIEHACTLMTEFLRDRSQ